MMNLAEDTNQSAPRPSVFGYTTQWSQTTPQYMPWGHSPSAPAATLVTFSAQLPQMSHQTSQMTFGQSVTGPSSSFGHKPFAHCKRKADLDLQMPSKQHITEEKMADHMSRLHISSESEHGNDADSDYFEEQRIREKRLYVCEEMRKLQTDSILPTALLGRLERPCMAVMLWQPPAKIPELIGDASTSSALNASRARMNNNRHLNEEDENDNNATTTDLNNMEMDS